MVGRGRGELQTHIYFCCLVFVIKSEIIENLIGKKPQNPLTKYYFFTKVKNCFCVICLFVLTSSLTYRHTG